MNTTTEPEQLPSSPEGVWAWAPVPYDPADYGTVNDWAADFDMADPAYNQNAPAIWSELRTGGCPVATSHRYGGLVVPVTEKLIREAAQDPERFSSRQVLITHARPGDRAAPIPIGFAPPVSSDPPFHGVVRRMLNPLFSPAASALWLPEINALCTDLAASLKERYQSGDVFDAFAGYVQQLPVAIICKMLGFPAENTDMFVEFVHVLLESGELPPRERNRRIEPLRGYQVRRYAR